MPRAASIHYRRYLPISDDDRAWGLHVTCGGYLRVPPETLDDYLRPESVVRPL
ncbi:MAG: hypothetical protein H0X45_16780 [Planctomycetes bacterium]|nr:hypothetical protein [Planctomycetota bacterium]